MKGGERDGLSVQQSFKELTTLACKQICNALNLWDMTDTKPVIEQKTELWIQESDVCSREKGTRKKRGGEGAELQFVLE